MLVHGIGDRRGFDLTRQTQAYDLLAAWGMPVSHATSGSLDTIEEVEAFVARYGEQRHSVEHEIDGVVVKVDEISVQRRLGGHVARAAVGHRLQVPARGGQHDAPRHPGQRRPHRPGHARSG